MYELLAIHESECNNDHVMQSSEISHTQKSNVWHFQYFILMFYPFKLLHFAENQIYIGPAVPMYNLLNGFQNNKKQKEIHAFACISKSVSPTSDWFR